MKIGKYDLNEKDAIRISKILSDFHNITCHVIEGVANDAGRSGQENKQYRLNIDNQKYTSVKLRYDEHSSHLAELVVNDIRKELKLENYKVKRISGFPMNGDKWRTGDCLLIDWGIQNSRVDLNCLDPSSLNSEDKEVFFEEIATNGAMAYALGLWDRGNRNFVWDKTKRKIISIDHENFTNLEIDLEIPDGIASVMTRFFGINWYEDKKRKTRFTEIFSKMWYVIAEIKDTINKIFQNHGYQTKSLIPRIEKGPSIPLSLIMMPAVYR